MVKQKSSSKKKGLKGKKARAKAKLEKQWGETAIIEDDKPHRVGKSRLKARTITKDSEKTIQWASNEVREQPSVPTTSSQDIGRRGSSLVPTSGSRQQSSLRKGRTSYNEYVSDSEGNDSEDDDAPAVQGLLDAIRKAAKRSDAGKNSKRKDRVSKDDNDSMIDENPESDIEMQEEDDDDSSNHDSESETEESDVVEQEDDEELVEEHSDDEDDDDHGDDKMDLFYAHFNQAPMTLEQTQNMPSVSHKIIIDSTTELHVTTATNSVEDSTFKSTTSLDQLKRLADSSFQGNRKALKTRWTKVSKGSMTERQSSIYPFLTRYMDTFLVTESRKYRKEVQLVNLLHLLNHVLTSRTRVQRHNRQLKLIEDDNANSDADETGKETPEAKEEVDHERFRDQGYTRPTVLVLLPNRGICHQFVHSLIRLTGADKSSPHVERFDAEFGPTEGDGDDEEGKTPVDPNKEQRRKAVLEKKGKDWNELFGDNVNQDDDFKLGIALTPKVATKNKKNNSSTNVQVKLYTDFFRSDIIIASPIGLKMLIAPDEDGKEGDSDFLSSIEICMIQNADILMMQNWDHVNDVLSSLNQEPKKNNDTDFSRVRRYMLEGQGAHWRQLIISTDFVDPYIISAFKRFGKSKVGSMKIRRKTLPEEASLANVLVPMKQVFQRIPVTSLEQQTDSRTQYFMKHILPEIQRHKQKHTMVYIPSYFDFVALRNIFLKREISFVSVHEYSRHTEVSRGRARFLQGRKPILLYTGRANFFYRHAIRGIRHLIFLGLPEHAQFYADQVNLIITATSLNDDGESLAGSSCLALFTRFEAYALERITGSANSSRMIKGDKATFMFHS